MALHFQNVAGARLTAQEALEGGYTVVTHGIRAGEFIVHRTEAQARAYTALHPDAPAWDAKEAVKDMDWVQSWVAYFASSVDVGAWLVAEGRKHLDWTEAAKVAYRLPRLFLALVGWHTPPPVDRAQRFLANLGARVLGI
jgi:hypothetical protein